MELMDVYFNVSMSNGHDGLLKMMGKKTERTALFINKKWTAAKMYVPEQYAILHIRRPAKQPIDPKTLKYLPRCVEGSTLNYGKALELAITREYEELRR